MKCAHSKQFELIKTLCRTLKVVGAITERIVTWGKWFMLCPSPFSPLPIVESAVIIGADYVLKQEDEKDNPFRKTVRVKVRDVQSGWVLYSMYPLGGCFQSESKRVKDFLAIYRAI